MAFQYQVIEKCIIEHFQALVVSIPHVLAANGIKHHVVYEGIGMSRSTWERRLKNKNFTIAEMLKLADFVNNICEQKWKKEQKRMRHI